MTEFDPSRQGAPSPTPPAPGGPAEQDAHGTAAQVAPADTPPSPAPPAEAPAPQAGTEETVSPLWTTGEDGELAYRGVPLFQPNPNIPNALGILAAIDTDATHEAGQKRTVTGTFPPEYEEIPRSGGSAYYYDVANGQGWSVALAPEGD